jgi:hypothetical protein
LTAYGSTSSAQQVTTWTNPYFYYHYNTPPTPTLVPGQKVSSKMLGNQKLISNYNDHSMQNTLGSHVVLLTTCLRDLKSKLKNKTKQFVMVIRIHYVKNYFKLRKPICYTHILRSKMLKRN